MLAHFGCEEVKVVHGEEEDQSAGRLVVPEFPDGARDEEQGPSSSGKNPKGDDAGRKEDVNRKSLCNRIPIRPRKRTKRLPHAISSATLNTARTEPEISRCNPQRPSWKRTGTFRRAAL